MSMDGLKKGEKGREEIEQIAVTSTQTRKVEAETVERCQQFQEGMTNGDEDLLLCGLQG